MELKTSEHTFIKIGFLVIIGFAILAYLSITKLWWAETGIQDRPLFYFGIVALIIGSQLFLAGFLAELVARNSTTRNPYQVIESVGITEAKSPSTSYHNV